MRGPAATTLRVALEELTDQELRDLAYGALLKRDEPRRPWGHAELKEHARARVRQLVAEELARQAARR